MTDIRRTVIHVAPDDEVEIDVGPCSCLVGKVCADNDPFAPLCPRRLVGERFLVLRGAADAPLYVRKLLGEIGAVEWTDDREAAHRFTDRVAATYVQQCIVARDGRSAAVVPESAQS